MKIWSPTSFSKKCLRNVLLIFLPTYQFDLEQVKPTRFKVTTALNFSSLTLLLGVN